MEWKIGKIMVILSDLGFELGDHRDWFDPYVFSKSIKMGSVTAKYTIEVDDKKSDLYLNIFGLNYKMSLNNENLIKQNAIIDAMLKILVKAEETSTRIYGNFVGELNDLK